jgi:hypothetical protein
MSVVVLPRGDSSGMTIHWPTINLFYGEYKNNDPDTDVSGRVKWPDYYDRWVTCQQLHHSKLHLDRRLATIDMG